MSLGLSGRELRHNGVPLGSRDLLFLADHPEYKGLTPILRGTFYTCQGADEKVPRPVELDEVLRHFEGCEWCRSHFANISEETREQLRA